MFHTKNVGGLVLLVVEHALQRLCQVTSVGIQSPQLRQQAELWGMSEIATLPSRFRMDRADMLEYDTGTSDRRLLLTSRTDRLGYRSDCPPFPMHSETHIATIIKVTGQLHFRNTTAALKSTYQTSTRARGSATSFLRRRTSGHFERCQKVLRND